MIKKFGLLGKNISYSFSQKYFTEKFRQLNLPYTYELFDMSSVEEFEKICSIENLAGVNVTIPYKQQILPFLDELSPEAAEIGAVNTVKISGNRRLGYNTDVFGFDETLQKYRKSHHDSALIMGNGGAAKAVAYVLQQHSIPFQIVSRSEALNFDTLSEELVATSKIIVQCTPVGTFPDTEKMLKFPFDALSAQHLVIDLIYNPEETAFLREAAHRNAVTVNGRMMLEKQADKAWEIWNSPF